MAPVTDCGLLPTYVCGTRASAQRSIAASIEGQIAVRVAAMTSMTVVTPPIGWARCTGDSRTTRTGVIWPGWPPVRAAPAKARKREATMARIALDVAIIAQPTVVAGRELVRRAGVVRTSKRETVPLTEHRRCAGILRIYVSSTVAGRIRRRVHAACCVLKDDRGCVVAAARSGRGQEERKSRDRAEGKGQGLHAGALPQSPYQTYPAKTGSRQKRAVSACAKP
jgi:hypothetical protein